MRVRIHDHLARRLIEAGFPEAAESIPDCREQGARPPLAENSSYNLQRLEGFALDDLLAQLIHFSRTLQGEPFWREIYETLREREREKRRESERIQYADCPSEVTKEFILHHHWHRRYRLLGVEDGRRYFDFCEDGWQHGTAFRIPRDTQRRVRIKLEVLP